MKVVYRRSGFTLIEVLVVLTIMGVLTAIIAPRVNQYLEDANIKATQQELHNLKNALISFRNKTQPPQFPSSLKAVADYFDHATFTPSGQLLDKFNQPYRYKTWPAGGLEHQRFEITSAGADRIFGPNPQKGNKNDDLSIAEGFTGSESQNEEDNAYEEEFE